MPSALEYARELIEFNSVSSLSNLEITNYLADRLRQFGMEIERIDFVDPSGVAKFNIIGKLGAGQGGFGWFGHSDVVPVTNWTFPQSGPFTPCFEDGKLYGRGSTDMKGPVGCMLAAIETFAGRSLREPIYFGCTADEEVGMLGAEHLVMHSRLYREMVEGNTRAVVGEPTGLEVIHAHKGGCGILVRSRGRAAHSSTNLGVNANWRMIPFLQEMKALHDELESDPHWQDSRFEPPTMSLNLGINDHNPALNITAPQSICTLYFRAMPGMNTDPILERIRQAAEDHELEFQVTFRATPFSVDPYSQFVQECLEYSPSGASRTVSYGTDAARFTELKQCVVMGPGNIAQAHTCDEWVSVDDLERGADVYRRMIERWCL